MVYWEWMLCYYCLYCFTLITDIFLLDTLKHIPLSKFKESLYGLNIYYVYMFFIVNNLWVGVNSLIFSEREYFSAFFSGRSFSILILFMSVSSVYDIFSPFNIASDVSVRNTIQREFLSLMWWDVFFFK